MTNKALTRSNFGTKEHIWSVGYSPSWKEASRGVQGRNPEQRAWSSTAVRSLLWVAQTTFLYNPEPAAQGWHCPKWAGSPTPVISQESVPQNLPTGHSDGDIFSVEVIYPDDSSMCQADKRTSQNTESKFFFFKERLNIPTEIAHFFGVEYLLYSVYSFPVVIFFFK